MGQTVIKVDQQTLDRIEKHYANNKINKQPPHTVFVAKQNGCTVTGYTSGKVMFQGSTHEEEASRWGVNPETKKKQHTVSSASKEVLSLDHIGSDEAGTGDYFGPITVGAVYATEKQQALLQELGVKDSKSMNDKTITSIVKDILKTDIVYSTVTLHNERYNQLKQKNWSQVRMKAWMHHHAIQHVINKLDSTKPSGIVIDQFCEPGVYYNKIKASNDTPHSNITFLTKAESQSTCVAAASMLARYRFVQEMDKLSKKVAFELQKGASNKVDQQIKRIIETKGEPFLDQIGKVHFGNTQKAKKKQS
ncbi:ribonuclease HIII [Alkalibacillus filiformis]|uniref:Ribonuclease HIII n=1 Tax=Alkalibacillus filiformis TaxID=200990 RepID=A0ABU0DSN9_9BACI|nr:ribonuclease HIII [Alkalibacillus filiformis]MDQ0351205.1 ribonuclease HIII [Alkalibacillus filiformis]